MFHTKDHTKLINSSPYSQVLHAYSHTSCIFKINNQPQTNFGEQNTKPTLSSLRLEAFTQATGTVSLKLGSLAWASALQWHFASSRLGETFSPEQDLLAWARSPFAQTKVPRLSYDSSRKHRVPHEFSLEWDGLSLKTRALRLSEMLEQNQGEFLLFLPKRDELVWARISVLVTVPRMQSQRFIQNSKQCIFVPS